MKVDTVERLTPIQAGAILKKLPQCGYGVAYYDVNLHHTEIGGCSEPLDYLLTSAIVNTQGLWPKALFTREYVSEIVIKVPNPTYYDKPDVIARFMFDTDRLLKVACEK